MTATSSFSLILRNESGCGRIFWEAAESTDATLPTEFVGRGRVALHKHPNSALFPGAKIECSGRLDVDISNW